MKIIERIIKRACESLLPVIFIYLTGCSERSKPFFPSNWEHFSIDSILPGNSWGTGGFTLADFDLDGDLDITISQRSAGGNVYWYENRSDKWIRHHLGISDLKQLGSTECDINNDGYPDLVVARCWFENPGVLNLYPDSLWTRHTFNGGMPQENHDIVAFDFDLDGKRDILCYSQKAGRGHLRLYCTEDPYKWTFIDIDTSVNETVKHIPESKGIHGGFAPGGPADFDNDRYPDIPMPGGWYKNPGSDSNSGWKLNPWPFQIGITPNLYGLSMRSESDDLDLDGDNDIVYTDCDNEGSKGYWIENIDHGKDFVRHELPPPGDTTGSFHSLAVADFDNDGDLDIFTGEQEDPNKGMKQEGLKERGFFWENTGSSRKPSFAVRIIHTDNPGWHDTQAGDVDGDGDLDLVTKIWNKDGAHYHADLWINKLIP